MRISIPRAAQAVALALLALQAGPAHAIFNDGDQGYNPHSGPNVPYYRIRYLADVRDGEGDLIEEGVFDEVSQANVAIDLLAHLLIAYRVDCACETYRRDVFGANDLEERLRSGLSGSGYVPRLVPAPQVASLPEGTILTTPYLRLSGDGYLGSSGWGGGWGSAPTTTVFNPNDPSLYVRLTVDSVFIDTRLESFVLSRVNQLMGGYTLNDPTSLCAFAALERSPDNMLSWVLIEDLRRTWPGEETR